MTLHSFTEYLLDAYRGRNVPSRDMNKLWFPPVDSAASHRVWLSLVSVV